eukprot:7258059-Pyramimonas_sp.AAC.1
MRFYLRAGSSAAHPPVRRWPAHLGSAGCACAANVRARPMSHEPVQLRLYCRTLLRCRIMNNLLII